MDYTLYNSIEQIDRTLSGAYYTLVVAGTGLVRWVPPPATPTSSGVSGYNVSSSGAYLYWCTGVNKWGRVQLASW